MNIDKTYDRLFRSLFFGLLLLAAAPQAALADEHTTYFVPLPDNELFHKLDQINSAASSPLISIFSMVVVTTGTRIYWDHWEGGYQTDIFNPGDACTGGPPFTNHCTQIWGDGDTSNGCAPIIHRRGTTATIQNPCAAPADDLLNRGDVVITIVEVPIPRHQADACTLHIGTHPSAQGYCYDGADKIGTTFPVVAQRIAYPSSPGSLFAGATEVVGNAGFAKAGDSFVVPVGQSTSSNQMFQNTSVWLMAGEGGATVTSTDIRCFPSLPAVLPQGGWLRCNNANAGDVLHITAGSAQAHLITADNGASYEMRWYQLAPKSTWSNAYIASVGTSTTRTQCTSVWLYNDNSHSITVQFYIGTHRQRSIIIRPGRVVQSSRIPDGQSASFDSRDTFAALTTTDCNGGQIFDWGYPLIPTDKLTTQVIAGFARGCTDDCSDPDGHRFNSRSPLWITPTDSTTLYVDYDGIGGFCDADGHVQGDVGVIPAIIGASIKIFDDQTPCSQTSPPPGPTGRNGRQCDNDMTGARIFTCDGTKIAAAWGQDPSRSGSGDSDGLDLGTLVAPLGSTELVCNNMVAKAENSPFPPTLVPVSGPDDQRTVKYEINLQNVSSRGATFRKEDITLTDVFSLGGSLVEDPTDPPYAPSCLSSPLVGLTPDSGDINHNDIMDPGESWVYVCYARVISGSSTDIPVTNTAEGTALASGTGGTQIEAKSNICEATIQLYDPDLAMLSDFRAYATGGGVLLEWKTGIEAGTLGFHLERKNATGEFERLNAGMLPAVLRGQSGVYRYRDGGASAGMELTYRLLEVQNDDSTRTIGEFTVTPEGEAPKLPRKSKAAAKNATATGDAASAAGFESEVLVSPSAEKRAERARASKQALKARRKAPKLPSKSKAAVQNTTPGDAASTTGFESEVLVSPSAEKRAKRARASKQALKALRKAGSTETGATAEESK